jgi:uncharacterized protein YlxW (UPF0749 family)
MQSNLDAAITAASSAEATYTADSLTVSNIQASIATATAPLAPAEAQVSTDATAFNAALQALSAAALAAMVPVPGSGS